MGIVSETGDDTSHIVSPAFADDNDVLESYLSTLPEIRRRCIIHTNPSSNRPLRPVLFNTVPRRPLGVTANQSPAAMKCEIIEKYLEPYVQDVVDLWVLYFFYFLLITILNERHILDSSRKPTPAFRYSIKSPSKPSFAHIKTRFLQLYYAIYTPML
jgi:hypothetical protein